MKRKIIGAAAAYLSGLFFASFFTKGSDFLLLAGMFPVFFIICLFFKVEKADILIISVSFTAAFTAYHLYTNMVYDKAVVFDNTVGSYEGEIISVEYYDDDLALYTLDGKINNSVKAKTTFLSNAYNVEIGDRLTLENCNFATPENDYLFNSVDYNKANKIFIICKSADIVEIEHTHSHKLKNMLIDYREKMIMDFSAKAGSESGSLIAGIVFGRTSGIDDTDRTLMYRCGIGHVLAVSGLHISIIAALIMSLLKKLHINKFISFGVLEFFLLLMIILVEYPSSAVRAAIMLSIMYSAGLFLRQNDSFNSLACSILIMCMANPYIIGDRGFLLSITGTFGIAVFGPYMAANMKRDSLLQKLVSNFVIALCVMLILFPLNIIYFNESSLISPFTNLIIVPITVVIMIIGFIYVLTGGFVSFLGLAGKLAELVMAITNKLGRVEFIRFSCGNGRVYAAALICTAFVIFVYLLYKQRRAVAAAIAGAMTIFSICTVITGYSDRDDFAVSVLGRGTNCAVVITYHDETVIFDLSGHYKTPEYVYKYLDYNKQNHIKSLILCQKTPSQYMAYTDTLELMKIDSVYAGSSNGISEITETNDNPIQIENENYLAVYADGVLTITYNAATIMFANANSGQYSDGALNVYYGNISKNTEPIINDHTIYLDEIVDFSNENNGSNNFEIEIDGTYKVRRL